MKDLLMARQLLKEYGHSLVIVKNQKIIYLSDDSGIKSFIDALITNKEDLIGARAADKVVGYSLAHLLVYAKVSAVYAEMISEKAKDYLEKNDIVLKYGTLVPFILNKTKDNLCLFETMAEDFTSAADAFDKINGFFMPQKNKESVA